MIEYVVPPKDGNELENAVYNLVIPYLSCLLGNAIIF